MSERSRDVFQRSVRQEFAFLKSTRAIDQLHARSIVVPGDRGLLVPVCELHADDQRVIASLHRWREQSALPATSPASDGRTVGWLRSDVLDRRDRILFLVCDRHGHPVGQLGLTHALESDRRLELGSVVRCEPDDPGLMSAATKAAMDWAHELFGPRQIYLHVCEDNERTKRFFERLGFTVDAPASVAAPGAHAARRMVLRPRASEGTILTAGPSISARETSYALDAVRNGWNGRHSDYLDAFSAAFAEYVGVRHALPTSSCTGALHLSMLALGVGPGDEVVVPDLTWVATANAVAYTGATPIFADVQEQGWCLEPRAFEAAITPRTKAVIPVHLYGHPAQMDEICRIAREHELHVVEDAAPSIGAETAGRRTGSFGAAGCFSFQGAKLIVTGEGGMLVTDDEDLYERARYLWGLAHEGDFWIGELGWKYRMSNVQAAVGLGQLERVDALVEAKRRIFGWYAEELDGVRGLELSHEAPFARSIHWMTSARVLPEAGVTRDELRAGLRAVGVDTRPVFPAISRYPMWTPRQLPGPVADRIGRQGVNLPSGVCLRREDVARVCTAIVETLEAKEARAA